MLFFFFYFLFVVNPTFWHFPWQLPAIAAAGYLGLNRVSNMAGQ